MTSRYRITNATSGVDLGVYEASDAKGALDALARDAGYRNDAHARTEIGQDGSELIVEEVRPVQAAGYVVVQWGGPVYGVGETQEQAWADAAEWLDAPLTDDTTSTPRVHGAVYCLPASAELVAAVQTRGGDVRYDVEQWPIADVAES